MTTKRIFFSYSWKDIPIAMRIYADLVRNGIPVWRDEFSTPQGKKFETEIARAMEECEGVILLDSENSRSSKYVWDEWQVLIKSSDWIASRKKIAICLIDDVEITHKNRELFFEQNKYRYIDFSNCKQLFDNDRSYLYAIKEVCKTFEVPYSSPHPELSLKDFEDELSKYKIKDIDRTILLKEFELIQLRLNNGFSNTLERLEHFTRECESLKLVCPSPLLQLGIEFLKCDKLQEASYLFNFYTTAYPDDPRGWRAYGNALAGLEKNEEALVAYTMTIFLSLCIKFEKQGKCKERIRFDSKKNLKYLFASRMNRATLLSKLKKEKQATRAYKQALYQGEADHQLLPEHYLIVINACASWEERRKWIELALLKFNGDYSLILEKARWFIRSGKREEALESYTRLAQKDIPDLEVYAEYLPLLLMEKGYTSQFVTECHRALQIVPETPRQEYKYGFIYYIAGNITKAKKYFEKSKCQTLPWYEELFS